MLDKKSRFFFFAVLFFGIFGVAGKSHAANFYITQNASGGDTGASCANAHSAAWFNTSGNWGTGTGKISAGDTVHLCGTFTGGSSGTIFEILGSGISGSPITIKAETGAIITSAAAEYHIHARSKSYLVIDGGTNGIIRATDNGSRKTYQNWSAGVEVYECNNVVVKNWTIQNMFVHVQGDGSYDMRGVGVANWYSSNVTIENNTINDACFGTDTVYNTGSQAVSNILIQNNTISNFNIAIHIASAWSNAAISNVQILNNDLSTALNWDDPANSYHHNAVHAYAVHDGTSITGLTIANNYVHGNWSTEGHNTSAFYVELSPGTGSGLYVYNNLIAPQQYSGGNAFIYCKGDNPLNVYNNTIVGQGATHAYELNGGGIIKNNIMSGLDRAWTSGTGITADHNIYYNLSSDAWASGAFAAWQSSGQDANSYVISPNLDGIYHPVSGSQAIDFGTSLSSLGITLLNSDRTGVSRPQGSAWDIGAYEYASGGTIDSPPAAPTGLAVN